MSLLTPVRYPAKRYSHTDQDAPVLTSADGAIKTILKACLITGYGTKASAGWTSLFEDATRVVLQAPASGRALGLPDRKIENGAGKYRVSSQANPTSINDASKLAITPLLTKGEDASKLQPKWELIATDVGFIFWYAVDEGSYATGPNPGCILGCFINNNLLLQGGAIPVVFHPSEGISATNGSWSGGWLPLPSCRNLMNNSLMPAPISLITSIDDPAVNLYQHGISGTTLIPSILYTMTSTVRSDSREVIQGIDQRYLRACFVAGQVSREYFIPIDYWEV